MPSHMSSLQPTSSPSTPSCSPCHNPPPLASANQNHHAAQPNGSTILPEIQNALTRDLTVVVQAIVALATAAAPPVPSPPRGRRRPRLRVVAEHHNVPGLAAIPPVVACQRDGTSSMMCERGRRRGTRQWRRGARTEGALPLPRLPAAAPCCRDVVHVEPDAAAASAVVVRRVNPSLRRAFRSRRWG